MTPHRLGLSWEPLLWLGAATATAEAFVARSQRASPHRRAALAAAVALGAAVAGRQLVTPWYAAEDELPQNAGLPSTYRPPPRP